MTDLQAKLRAAILALCQDYIGDPIPGKVTSDCIEAAAACMGAAAFMVAVLPPEQRAIVTPKLLENFPKRSMHLAEEIRRGDHDERLS